MILSGEYSVEFHMNSCHDDDISGVPVSTQWESQGYYYPTQIAQFGLSHYSKNLTEPEPRRTLLEDAERDLLAHWVVPSGATLSRVLDSHTGSHVVQFSSPGM
jgi:heparosan-N-sulfate-glucuronate 5-epimerase